MRRLERFPTKAAARRRLAAWIEEYNHQRRHSALGMRSPIDYELALIRTGEHTHDRRQEHEQEGEQAA